MVRLTRVTPIRSSKDAMIWCISIMELDRLIASPAQALELHVCDAMTKAAEPS